AAYDKQTAKLLLECGADINARNRHGAAPLLSAAAGGPHRDGTAQASIIKFLIESGADPDATDKRGVTPLHR
ncbi:ankyrin repeat domain-containing protein, partial [Clostridioides difficile]|uniref:ankyrin repeat domain-containing protein n=1 Tax=Clostridioides difficile TaxID=1496 RepID=UPI002ED0BD69|nr:hypothetical protein [Clostridioides difficile]